LLTLTVEVFDTAGVVAILTIQTFDGVGTEFPVAGNEYSAGGLLAQR
jgi:hypothetical protein